jgi:TolB protein
MRITFLVMIAFLWCSDSRAERKILFEAPGLGGKPDIFAVEIDGSGLEQLTRNEAIDGQPHWSPDGKQVAFSSNRDGNFEIYVMNSDGSHVRRLTNTPYDEADPDWAPDGKWLAFHVIGGDERHIVAMNLENGQERRLTTGTGRNYRPDWSPERYKDPFRSRAGR